MKVVGDKQLCCIAAKYRFYRCQGYALVYTVSNNANRNANCRPVFIAGSY